VSLKLLDVYANEGLTLDQQVAFRVNDDQARREQMFLGD
jgi:hypothetical protein